jgi:hypothetical protein
MSPEGRLADAGLPPALEDVGHARPILERLKDGPRLPKNPRQACGILSREPFQVVKGHEGTELASRSTAMTCARARAPLPSTIWSFTPIQVRDGANLSRLHARKGLAQTPWVLLQVLVLAGMSTRKIHVGVAPTGDA